MKPNSLAIAVLFFALPMFHGCSGPAPPAAIPEDATSAMPVGTVGDARPKNAVTACDLVTAAEMSTILGSTVSAESEERPSNDETSCFYKLAESLSPDVTFTLNRGHGEAAMSAMGMMGQMEPGIANPYEGLGDQAAIVGPQLWIRTGDDLVTLQIAGVDDVPAVAKRILDTAQARM